MSDKEPSGAELDSAIAERVMQWTLADRRGMRWDQGPEVWITGDEENPTEQDWHPSESIRAAMQVVEKLAEGPWAVTMSSGDERTEKEWFVEFIGVSEDGAHLLTGEGASDKLPEAVCRAALDAVGSKE